MLVLAFAITQACKKKKETTETPNEPQQPPTPVIYDNYSQLKIGNYWIYERFNIDPQGNATSQNLFDSCYISKDTVIRGQTYFKYHNKSYFSDHSYLRDSLHYIVYSGGAIAFSSQDFSTIFSNYWQVNSPGDTLYKAFCKMADKDLQINTPAGNFITSSYQTKYNISPNYSSNTVRYKNTRYAKNIGMISETQDIFIGTTATVERRLKRYHIN